MGNARTVVSDIGYELLPNEAYERCMGNFTERKVGSVFDGKAQRWQGSA